jgi:hypothetical protein
MVIVSEGWMVTDSESYPFDRKVYATYDEAISVASQENHDYNFVVPVRAIQDGNPIQAREFEP